MAAAAKKMSSSKRIIRDGTSLPSFAGQLVNLRETKAQQVRDAFEEAREAGHAEGSVQGYRDGHASGYAHGEEEGRSRAYAQLLQEQEAIQAERHAAVDQFCAEMESFVERTNEAVEAWTRAAEERLAGLAVEIASRAVSSELMLSRESVLNIVREALAEAEHARQVRIRVNPMDVATLESHQQEIAQALASIKGLEVVPDPSIQAGCVVESDSGVVDARVEAYLARLADQVRRAA